MRKLNRTTKILLLIPLLLCFLSVTCSSVQALPTIAAEYTFGATNTNTATYLNAPHPSSGTISASSAVYQTFKTIHNGTYLTEIDLYILKASTPSAIYRLEIYNVTGTYGSTSTPTGAALETSSTDLQISTLQVGTYTEISFTFAGTLQLIADTPYALVYYEVSEVTCSTSQNSMVALDDVSNYPGNMGYYYANSWSSAASQDDDLCFAVWGEGSEQEVLYLGGDTFIETVEAEYTIDATAEFNNTQISAEGGTAAAETPINYYNSGAIILLAIICIALTVKPSVPILNFCFGIITFGIAAATAGQTDMLLYGYIQILAVIMAIICMLSGYNSWKR